MFIREFHPSDLDMLPLQPEQADDLAWVTAEKRAALAAGPAWTAEDDHGLLGCGGLLHCYGETAIAWAFFAEGVGNAMVPITRHARAAIADAPWRRIEATTLASWPAANRWARLLGLEHRTLLRLWGPQAMDMNLWELVR